MAPSKLDSSHDQGQKRKRDLNYCNINLESNFLQPNLLTNYVDNTKLALKNKRVKLSFNYVNGYEGKNNDG